MGNKNYNEYTENFFKEFEEALHKILLIRNISSIASIVSAVAFFVFGIVPIDDIGEPLFFISTILLIASLITFRVSRKKVKNQMSIQKDKFFDNVYMQILADEIGANVTSISETNTKFKKKKTYPGEVLNSRYISISGEYNGCPYELTKAAQTVVDQITYKSDTKKVVSFKTVQLEEPLQGNCKIKRKADSTINITSPSAKISSFDDGVLALPKVKMDNKRFGYTVRCNDDVAAYKFITADVMEDIMVFDSFAKLQGITIENNEMSIISDANIVNMKYEAALKKNNNKNIENFTADSVLSAASADVERVKSFLKAIPLTATSRIN